MIPIDKNVPIPNSNKTGPKSKSKYPFREMEVGDSFPIDGLSRASTIAIASTYGKKLGRKFTSRTTPTGFRIWRIA